MKNGRHWEHSPVTEDAYDFMWRFLMDYGQKENIPAFKDAVYDLIKATTQKDAGQRKTKGNIDWSELEMIMINIVIEATALVLSGRLDELTEKE